MSSTPTNPSVSASPTPTASPSPSRPRPPAGPYDPRNGILPVATPECTSWFEGDQPVVTRLPDTATAPCFVALSQGETTSGPRYFINGDDPEAYQETTGLARMGEFGSYGYIDLNGDGVDDTVVTYYTPDWDLNTSIYITNPEDAAHPWVAVISTSRHTLPDFRWMESSSEFLLGAYGCPIHQATITGNPPRIGLTELTNVGCGL